MKINKLGILSLLIAICFLITGCWNTGNGVAQDTIYQIQYDGVIFQTYDVWLTNDHPTDNDNAIYCPETYNQDLVKKIQLAVLNKTKCEIYYHNELIIAPWRCSGNTIIDDIKC